MPGWHLARARVSLRVLAGTVLAFLATTDEPSADAYPSGYICLLWCSLALNARETLSAVYEVFI